MYEEKVKNRVVVIFNGKVLINHDTFTTDGTVLAIGTQVYLMKWKDSEWIADGGKGIHPCNLY